MAEAASSGSVKGKRIEVGLGVLEVRLPGGPFLVGRSYEWSHRKLGECDCRYYWLVRKWVGLPKTSEQYECAGIEYPARHELDGGVEDLVEILAQPVRV